MTIQDDINNFNSTCGASKLVKLAAQTDSSTPNRVVSVATVNDLPDLKNQTIDQGTIFYVESLKTPVIAHVGCWTGLDNRELRNDYTVGLAYVWGCNSFGQVGNSSVITAISPVSVVGGFTDWCSVRSGYSHTIAIRPNGTIWSWGRGDSGQLGDNTLVNKSSPVSVVGGFTDWCQASAGSVHNLAIRANGTLWAWGNAGQGRLGDNSQTQKSSPVSVVGGFTDWCQASAGQFHSLAIRTNCSLWAWGSSSSGQLGDDTDIAKSSPVSVVGGFTDWCQASAGGAHSLGIRINCTLWAWGCNSSGQLGDNSAVSKSSPVSVVGGFTDWCQASAGLSHSLAVRTNGTLWAWGNNGNGRLGDNSTLTRSSPVSVVGGFTDWCQVSAGTCHSTGIRTNGTRWAWGLNTCGQLGDGTVTSRNSPVFTAGGITRWCQVSAGNAHSSGVISF